jgi:hypothetical protein
MPDIDALEVSMRRLRGLLDSTLAYVEDVAVRSIAELFGGLLCCLCGLRLQAFGVVCRSRLPLYC